MPGEVPAQTFINGGAAEKKPYKHSALQLYRFDALKRDQLANLVHESSGLQGRYERDHWIKVKKEFNDLPPERKTYYDVKEQLVGIQVYIHDYGSLL